MVFLGLLLIFLLVAGFVIYKLSGLLRRVLRRTV
jgi:hypothetical protein